jgi:hypothetical protein
MHLNEIPCMPAMRAYKVGEFVRSPGNEELRAKVNLMLASLPPEKASVLRERFDLREEKPPPVDDFDLKLQAIAPDTLWQRYDPLSFLTSIGLRSMLRLHDRHLHEIDEEMCQMMLRRFPSDFDRYRSSE